jgi:S-DNA-T family DNA segregation ATPase FtsK/SpoIIIE
VFPLLDKASSRRSYDAERHHIRCPARPEPCLPHSSQDLLRISMRLPDSGTRRISRIDAYANDAYANENTSRYTGASVPGRINR